MCISGSVLEVFWSVFGEYIVEMSWAGSEPGVIFPDLKGWFPNEEADIVNFPGVEGDLIDALIELVIGFGEEPYASGEEDKNSQSGKSEVWAAQEDQGQDSERNPKAEPGSAGKSDYETSDHDQSTVNQSDFERWAQFTGESERKGDRRD